MIILHIVIWYINDNFTQSLLLSFGTSNKLDLLVYLLENMSQIEFIVDKHIWDISEGFFSIRTCGIDSVVWYTVFSFCQCNFYFSASR